MHYRKATWALVVWNVLIAIWLGTGLSAVGNECAGKVGDSLNACQAGVAIGGGIGVAFIGFIWFIGFVVLSLVWLMSRPSHREV